MPNLANKVTLLRIALIPVFLVFLLGGAPWGDLLAAAVFVVAALTDSVDGYLARKHNQITVFGQFLDPLADKLLISAALISLVGLGKLSVWPAAVIIARELAVSGLRVFAVANDRVVAAGRLGKLKTVSQVLAIIALILRPSVVPNAAAASLMGAAVVITVISGIDYYLKVRVGAVAGVGTAAKEEG
jgi:CDP-diacylglycerol---glycerol-3-phosphate 3-phosphatidyltransferase